MYNNNLMAKKVVGSLRLKQGYQKVLSKHLQLCHHVGHGKTTLVLVYAKFHYVKALCLVCTKRRIRVGHSDHAEGYTNRTEIGFQRL